jgi:hypothetical protein
MNAGTILLRLAHPNFMDGEEITSQVFMPSSSDEGRLSVYDGDQISPADSYVHYTEVSHNLAHSVWGVTCEEAASESVPASPAPLPGFASHVVMDFTGKSDKACRRVAKRLKLLALARGCLFLPA